jgi:CDP-diglyceride synthetase
MATHEQKEVDEPAIEEAETGGIRWKMAITAGVLGLVIGGFAAWATANLGIAPIAFVVGLAGGGYFLYQKNMPSEAIGSGLYVTALLMVVTPLLFYLPVVVGGGGNGAEEAGAFIGGVLGLVIWGFVFLLFAIVTGAVGYFFKRRAGKKRDENTQ